LDRIFGEGYYDRAKEDILKFVGISMLSVCVFTRPC